MFHPPPRYCRTSCLDHLVVIIGLHLTVVSFTNYVLLSDVASRASFACLDRLVVTLADVTSRVCRFEILNLLRVQLKSDVARSCGKQTFFFSLPKHHAITCHHAPASQQPAGCCQTRPGRVVHKLCRPPGLVTKGGGYAHNKIFLDRLAWLLSDVASRARHLQLESRPPDRYYCSIPHGFIYGLFPISKMSSIKIPAGKIICLFGYDQTSPPGRVIYKMCLDRLGVTFDDTSRVRHSQNARSLGLATIRLRLRACLLRLGLDRLVVPIGRHLPAAPFTNYFHL